MDLLAIALFIVIAVGTIIAGTAFTISMFLAMTFVMFSAGILFARDDDDGKIYERELMVSKLYTDKSGNRYVRLPARRTVHLPLFTSRTILVNFPSIMAYRIVRNNGTQKFICRYVRKRRGVVVTDEYLDIKPL